MEKDDTISRQAAIDAIKEHRALYCDNTPDTFSKLSYAEKSRVDELDTAISTLVNLPPAQPERKRGEWIKKMRVNETETYTSYDPEWYCSCCGTKYDSCVAKIINFCYVCGVDLREENDNG